MEHVAVIPSLSPWSSLCLEKVFKDLPKRNPFEIGGFELLSEALVSFRIISTLWPWPRELGALLDPQVNTFLGCASAFERGLWAFIPSLEQSPCCLVTVFVRKGFLVRRLRLLVAMVAVSCSRRTRTLERW
jgi:hypothetical protein